jgi:hypothetical protein
MALLNQFYRLRGVWLLLMLLTQASPAAAASLSDLSITNTRHDLRVSLRVKGAFTGPIEKAVASGVPTTFSFFIIVEEVRRFWSNRTLSDTTLTHTIKYEPLKNEFSVSRSWESSAHNGLKSPEAARRLMSNVENFNVIPLRQLEKGIRYRLRIKAKLSKMKLPLYLRYILVMPSKWQFETDWHEIEFIY